MPGGQVGGRVSPPHVMMSFVIAQSSINGAPHAQAEGGREGGKAQGRKGKRRESLLRREK